MPVDVRIAANRQQACQGLIHQARRIIDAEGATEASLGKLRTLLVDLADRGEALFPQADFAMPDGGGRNHPLEVEDGDGLGLYLTINMPGKEAAPHDHGIWCVNAGISGRELHRFYKRAGETGIEEIGQEMVEPGNGMFMTDHAIHYTVVVGDRPAWGLALYGYALARFPSVMWFHPEFGAMRVGASRRPAEAA
jgi:predicted metal-dependent enzyme (double-stranded beta helix superfamily)